MASACSENPTAPSTDICSGYADSATSSYVLPYDVGAAFTVTQGNCTPTGNNGGHRGVNRYAYDFDTPIGTAVRAMRGGVVSDVEESHRDGQVAPTGLDNYVTITHADGTVGLYGHLTFEGALVSVGDEVAQGQLIGVSGNTGNTANVPHLHVSVHMCDPVTGGSAGCSTTPITFRNTEANPTGLRVGRRYMALPYDVRARASIEQVPRR